MSEFTPLPTNLVDDELSLSQDGKRTYNIVDGKGNIVAEGIHFVDTSTYTTVGSNYGAEQINAQNEAINGLNEDLSELARKGALPMLDTDNPLYTFNGTHSSYTTTKECYIQGTLLPAQTKQQTLKIGNTPIAYATSSSGNYTERALQIEPFKVPAGKTITVTGDWAGATLDCLHVFEELQS